MRLSSSDYIVKYVDMNGPINVYEPIILDEIQKIKHDFVPWSTELDNIFDWLLNDVIEREFMVRVTNHDACWPEEARYIRGQESMKRFAFDVRPYIERAIPTINVMRIEHVKVTRLGPLLIVAVLPRKE